jgi:hypothetical protein
LKPGFYQEIKQKRVSSWLNSNGYQYRRHFFITLTPWLLRINRFRPELDRKFLFWDTPLLAVRPNHTGNSNLARQRPENGHPAIQILALGI